MVVNRQGHRHGLAESQAGQTFIRKLATESLPNDGSQQDDDDLYFSVVANGLYAFEAVLLVKSVINDSFIFEWVEPSGTTFQIQVSTPVEIVNLTETYGERLVATVAGVTSIIRCIGTIQVGPVGGIFRLRWR